jgi:hypothetical protein
LNVISYLSKCDRSGCVSFHQERSRCIYGCCDGGTWCFWQLSDHVTSCQNTIILGRNDSSNYTVQTSWSHYFNICLYLLNFILSRIVILNLNGPIFFVCHSLHVNCPQNTVNLLTFLYPPATYAISRAYPYGAVCSDIFKYFSQLRAEIWNNCQFHTYFFPPNSSFQATPRCWRSCRTIQGFKVVHKHDPQRDE